MSLPYYDEFDYSSLAYGDGIDWGQRENGDHTDPSSPLTDIPVGFLETVDTALRRLWKQYEAGPNWIALMTTIGDAFHELETALYELQYEGTWRNATGVQLEMIGEEVGRPRGSLVDDEDYRKAILVDTATLFSSGTLPEILELLGTLFEGSTYYLDLAYPAGIRIRVEELSADDLDLVVDLFSDVPAAGVGMVISTYDPAEVGGWSSINGATSNDAGWGSIHGAVATPAHWSTGRGV